MKKQIWYENEFGQQVRKNSKELKIKITHEHKYIENTLYELYFVDDILQRAIRLFENNTEDDENMPF